MDAGGNLGGEAVIRMEFFHAHGVPGQSKSRIGEGDVLAGLDDLIFERERFGGSGDRGGDGDGVAGAGLWRRVLDFAEERGWVVRRKDREGGEKER